MRWKTWCMICSTWRSSHSSRVTRLSKTPLTIKSRLPMVTLSRLRWWSRRMNNLNKAQPRLSRRRFKRLNRWPMNARCRCRPSSMSCHVRRSLPARSMLSTSKTCSCLITKSQTSPSRPMHLKSSSKRSNWPQMNKENSKRMSRLSHPNDAHSSFSESLRSSFLNLVNRINALLLMIKLRLIWLRKKLSD